MARKEIAKKARVAPEAAPEMLQQLKESANAASSAITLYGENPYELVLPDQMHEADYLAYGANLGGAFMMAGWRVGDYVNFGLVKFGYKDYAKVSAITGLDETYLRTCASVSGRVTPALRAQVSLERARLLLQSKNDKESVDHVFKRLADKTTVDLRKMRSSGGGKRKRKVTEVTATALYEQASELLETIEAFDSKTKLEALVAFERDKTTGGVIAQLGSFLKALCDQISDVSKQ